MHTCVIAYAHAMRIDVHVLLQCYYPRIIAVEAPPLAAPQLASLDDPTYSVKSEIRNLTSPQSQHSTDDDEAVISSLVITQAAKRHHHNDHIPRFPTPARALADDSGRHSTMKLYWYLYMYVAVQVVHTQ